MFSSPFIVLLLCTTIHVITSSTIPEDFTPATPKYLPYFPSLPPSSCTPYNGMKDYNCAEMAQKWKGPTGQCYIWSTTNFPAVPIPPIAAFWTGTHCNYQPTTGGCRLWYQCYNSGCKRVCTAMPTCAWVATPSPSGTNMPTFLPSRNPTFAPT
jgi:hypothetical protein